MARGNSSVEAWENSSVVAWENSVSRIFSQFAEVELYGGSVAILQVSGAVASQQSRYATIVSPPAPEWTVSGWIERDGVAEIDGRVILYKRVSARWQTQEGTPEETTWPPGATLEHRAWAPESGECGAGKYHGCSRPYFCDEFRKITGDRYIAVAVRREDMHAWENPEYPHKIAFRAGEVLYEVDRHGKQIKE